MGRHVGGASAKQSGERMFGGCIASHFFRSRFYYFVKHYGYAAAATAEVAEIALITARLSARVLLGRTRGELAGRLRAPILSMPVKNSHAR